MSPKISYRFIFSISSLVVASLACRVVTDFIDGNSSPYTPEAPVPSEPSVEPTAVEPTQTHPLTEISSCPVVTDKILEVATDYYPDNPGNENTEEPEELHLVTYGVSGNQIKDPFLENVSTDLIPYQQDEADQRAIWNYFATLIPLQERSALAEYSIVTDGEGNLLAAVAQTSYDPILWELEVDIRDSGDRYNLTYTLIHEYAHLLTLGPDQVIPSVAVFKHPHDDDIFYAEASSCPDYFPGEGCSKSDSYINVFFNRFWTDIHDEWQDINLIENDDKYYSAMQDFYAKYKDRFVTEYASTNPEEDIAEAFAFFVLSPRPDGKGIAEEKILFFYAYPELVQLREDIITGICSLNQ